MSASLTTRITLASVGVALVAAALAGFAAARVVLADERQAASSSADGTVRERIEDRLDDRTRPRPVRIVGRAVLVSVGVGLVVGLVAGGTTARVLTRPLRRTADAARQLGAGRRDVRVPVEGPPEVAEVAESLNALAGALETSEARQRRFLLSVSHELRTPLTSIYGFAETLLRRDVNFGDEERATFLRYISSESERLTAIVDRLLSVAQLDTGDMAVHLAETDVGAVVSEAVRTAEVTDARDGHRFVVDLADEPLAAEADREKLGQVLAHLLDNAVRYSPAGGTVTVAARRRDDAVEVSVEDEGVGIPHAEQERIFRKFYRGDRASSGAVGAGATGLGLFLAEGLVTAMGGRIWVDSDEGRGSTFVLELRAAGSET